MDHGEQDPVVPYRAALASRELLLEEDFDVEFNSYVMEHGLCPPQVESLRDWLVQRLQTARV
jgi:phospholipase/carboxylesterase